MSSAPPCELRNPSYYAATVRHNATFPALEGTDTASVCIVGGGFAGLATALGLIERGVTDVTLVEAERIGFGASGRNGGFVFGGYSLPEPDLVRRLGAERARSLYALTLDAIELMRRRIDDYGIDCQRNDAGVLLADWLGEPAAMEAKRRFMAEVLGVTWETVSQETVRARLKTARYAGGLLEPHAFHFHPLNYALGLAQAIAERGGRIYEASPVERIDRHAGGVSAITARGAVHAARVVIAGGGYLRGVHGRLAGSVLPIATYAMATAPLGARLREAIDTDWAVYDTRFAFDYYRRLPEGRLLWGGRISTAQRSRQRLERLLRRDLAKVYPQLAEVEIDYVWQGLMGYPLHKMPEIGEVEPGVWSALGFGGHGVSTTTVAGELLAAALAHGDDRYREFQAFGWPWALGPAGLVGAQASYWWYQLRDWLRERRSRTSRRSP